MNKKVCPVCKTEISKKWLLWGGYGKYVCSNCNSALSWTGSKRIRDGIATFFGMLISGLVITPYLIKQLGASPFFSILIAGISAGIFCATLLYVMNLVFQNDAKVEVSENI